MNQAINQMDEATQQNAALVEEAAAAAASLQDQAGHLVQVVSVLKIGGMEAAAVAPSMRAGRPTAVAGAAVVPIAAATRSVSRPAINAKPLKQISNAPTGGEWEEF